MNKAKGTVLIIDDDEDVLLSAELYLKQFIERVITESKPTNVIPLILREKVDVVVLDMNYSTGQNDGDEGITWLRKIKSEAPEVEAVMMTAYAGIDLAVKSIKYGAADFIIKPWENQKLLATILSAIQLKISKAEIAELREKQSYLKNESSAEKTELHGRSKGIIGVRKMVEKVASTDANALILGENGTGKDIVARMLHENSNRNKNLMVTVDCGAITETLFESEMFGAVKGAYTDLNHDKKGRFELASGGTLFLDEIGNLSLSMQSKLLTALQNRKIMPVGSTKEVEIDIRLVAATNMPIHEMVDEGTFRQDLLYRINTVEINIPPLRNRPEDISILLEHFIEKYTRKYRRPTMWLERGSMEKLIRYSWPGNVRELQHAVERAVIMGEKSEIKVEDILPKATRVRRQETTSLNLEHMEKKLIVEALEKCSGNISRASKELGITRTALYRRLDKYNLI
jgi:DNA-binding NtrC family response regulator